MQKEYNKQNTLSQFEQIWKDFVRAMKLKLLYVIAKTEFIASTWKIVYTCLPPTNSSLTVALMKCVWILLICHNSFDCQNGTFDIVIFNQQYIYNHNNKKTCI